MSQRRIRIESLTDEKGGSFIQILDAETKEPIEDLSEIIIKLKPNNVIVAEVVYNDGAAQDRYVEKVDAVISNEACYEHR